MAPRIIVKAKDGDGDGFVNDGTPQQRPARPDEMVGGKRRLKVGVTRRSRRKTKRAKAKESKERRKKGAKVGDDFYADMKSKGKLKVKVPPSPPKRDKSAPSGSAENPVRVKSAKKALELIAAGQHVEMDPKTVAVTLKKLSKIGKEAFERGESAPDYDLCLVHTPDTNLFCEDNQGILRQDMPQLKGSKIRPNSYASHKRRNKDGEVDLSKEYVAALHAAGVEITDEKVDAATLRATQSQLVGPKVGGMMAASTQSGGTLDLTKPIFVSSDGYIVDGHHRWAALTGLEFTEGQPFEINVRRIDMPIQELIPWTNRFTVGNGVEPKAAGPGAKVGKAEPPCVGCGEVGKRNYHVPSPLSSPKEIVGSHGHKPHGTSIRWPAMYEHLKAKFMAEGMPESKAKTKAAMISNGKWRKKRGLPPKSVKGTKGKVGVNKMSPTSEAVHAEGPLPVVGEKKTSREVRVRLADDGKALPDGSFPINSRNDLVRAIKAVGRAKDPAKARRHIISRARALGATELLPASWTVSKLDRQLKPAERAEAGQIVAKSDDKQQVFGWAYVTHDENGEVVVDKSGDFVDDPAELEDAAYDFVLHSRAGGADHAKDGAGNPVVKSTLIESMVVTQEKRDAMGLGPGPTGWWVGFAVQDPDLWSQVKDGRYKMFSIHGTGVREPV